MTGSRRALQDAALAALVLRQHGVASREQLRRLGYRRGHVAEHVAAGRWRLVCHDLVVAHTGPLDDDATLWLAVLGAPGDVAVGSWTGLARHGLVGWERPGLHVVVPRGAKPFRPPGVVVHESRRFAPEDVVRRDGLPVFRVERCAVDAAAWQASARTAVGLLAATVQQGLTTPDRLAEQLDHVGRVRFRTLMQRSLADIAGGADALSEIDLARLCRDAHLPAPLQQERRRDARGRWRYLDAVWHLPDGRRLVVEVDGVGHMEAARWYADLMRDAELLPDERTVRLRIPAAALRAEPERVRAVLEHYLRPSPAPAGTPARTFVSTGARYGLRSY
ncbi:PDDEXK family nuclease [Puerhibacterium puerhi]|uniref:hypothetical protein n=1 Tax=Puerhibacterium puerhi TaxID=2692623 RepID=UPI00191698D7|nr:hypothetical protein [Puerhibacterium puerhi]